ncbi:MAG: P-II family nitrogen regulator [Oscillospiraceae bacterium]|nr:P-II family nitrogen regulator [Oscillospiraceae bacterium]
MSDLHLMVTIIDRHNAAKFTEFYQKHGVEINLLTVGRGTAISEMLDYFGLEASEKAVLFSTVTLKTWKAVRYGLQNRMRIDVPGTGIAFIIPLSSVGGKRALGVLTLGQNYQKGEESTLKDTQYELLVVIANQGYNDLIMDAARKEGAGGGTIIHAKGTGMQKAAQFLGVSLASEKEIVFIVVKTEKKNAIMQAIMANAGLQTEAAGVAFSLPVTSTAGMRLLEADPETLQEAFNA